MKKKNKRNLCIFGIVLLIFILFLVIILPKYLYGRSLLSYYIQNGNYGRVYGKFNNIYDMPNVLNYKFMLGRFFSFIIVVCYIIFICWIRKNIKGNRKFIYPFMYLVLLFIIYFSYLSFVRMWVCVDKVNILLAPINNFLLSNYVFKIIFTPFNPFNIMFAVLVKIGDIVDFNSSKAKNKKMISNTRILEIASGIFVIQVLFMILFILIF